MSVLEAREPCQRLHFSLRIRNARLNILDLLCTKAGGGSLVFWSGEVGPNGPLQLRNGSTGGGASQPGLRRSHCECLQTRTRQRGN